MPTPDEELDAMLGSAPATGGNPDAELDAMLAGAPKAPAKPKGSAPYQPPAFAEAAGRGLDAPLKDQRGWWQKLTDQAENFSALPDGTYQDPQNPTLQEVARATDAEGLTGPKALKALSEAAVLNAVPTPFKGAGLAARAGNAAVSGGYQGGLTSISQGNSLPQVAEDTVVGGATSLGLHGLGEAGVAAGKSLMSGANKLRTHIFMTPAQRAAYKAAKGPDALSKLGASAREAGLFKGGLGPATAGRVAENADTVMSKAGAGIGKFEDDLVSSGVNPSVDVKPIGEALRKQAEYLKGRATSASPAQAAAFEREAAAVQPTEAWRRGLPREMPAEQMSLDLPEGSIGNRAPEPVATAAREQMSMPVASQAEMFPQGQPEGVTQWSPGNTQGEQIPLGLPSRPERFEDIQRLRTERPFSEAIADKRDLQGQIKWNKSAMQDTQGGEAARKASWMGHADQIDKALEEAAAFGKIPPDALEGYRQNMRNFSTAATVHDPAMKMAERQGQIGLGLGDMVAGAAAGDPGVALASRAGRGRGAAVGAAITETLSEGAAKGGQIAQAAARVVPAITQAAQNNPPGTPKSDIEREANSDTKKQLKGWWQHLTGE